MDDAAENLANEPPTDINPYEILALSRTATSSEVKSAYKKLALRYHPDKVPPSDRDSAHTKFQELAFAYAILSDERRRKRYDITGNTSESLDIEADDFNWLDFFRAQFEDPELRVKRLDAFKAEYQNSDEEKGHVLAAYKKFEGNMNKIFGEIMHSNPLDDEERFRLIIDHALNAGEVEAYHAYRDEPPQKRAARHKKAAKEAREAGDLAEEMGVGSIEAKNSKKGAKKGGKKGGVNEMDLAALIQQNQKSRGSIIDNLEAKYGGGKAAKNGKKRKMEGPPEEMFERNKNTKVEASRQSPRKRTKKDIVEDDDEDDVDLDDESSADEEGSEEQENMKQAKLKRKATRTSTRAKKGIARKK